MARIIEQHQNSNYQYKTTQSNMLQRNNEVGMAKLKLLFKNNPNSNEFIQAGQEVIKNISVLSVPWVKSSFKEIVRTAKFQGKL